MMKTLAVAIILFTVSLPSKAENLFINPTFAVWPHGSPRSGSYGSGTETAVAWISKWNASPASRLTAVKLPTGIQYAMRPASGVFETYYLRQTYGQLRQSLGKRFKATIIAKSLSPNVWYQFYINARWNNTNRIHIVTTDRILLSRSRKTYTIIFRMPSGAGVNWPVTDSAGVEFAFLFDTNHPAFAGVFYAKLERVP